VIDHNGQLKRFMEASRMFSKFLNLDPEKQDRIINAATKVFAQKGYQNASTNEIVKEAEISKGLLFHYFSNKKDLYLFLYDHLMEIFTKEIYEKINWNEKDIFNKFRQTALIKLELFQQYPEMFKFIKAVYIEDSSDVKLDLDRRNREILTDSYEKLFTDIDFSKFKEGIDIKKAMNIIVWTLEGFAYQQQDKETLLNLDETKLRELIVEMDLYIETLKKAFYQ
jgi:TetR/AcrR family transcriptional regulator